MDVIETDGAAVEGGKNFGIEVVDTNLRGAGNGGRGSDGEEAVSEEASVSFKRGGVGREVDGASVMKLAGVGGVKTDEGVVVGGTDTEAIEGLSTAGEAKVSVDIGIGDFKGGVESVFRGIDGEVESTALVSETEAIG